MLQEVTIQGRLVNKGLNWRNFISFRKMITPQIIKAVYIIGACLITLFGLAMIFTGGNLSCFIPGGALTGIIFLLFGNLLWRISCELVILFFRINDTLSEIEKNIGKE